jgi:hypothetical protein
MHSILWASILSSAAVAILTTLLVEYLAKPSLEARKDRILENRRERRKAISGIRQSYLMTARLMAYINDVDLPSGLAEYVDEMAKAVRDHAVFAYATISVPESISHQWRDTIFTMQTFALSFSVGRPREEVWKEWLASVQRLKDFGEYLMTPSWHLRRRSKLVRKIKSSPLLSEETDEAREERQ